MNCPRCNITLETQRAMNNDELFFCKSCGIVVKIIELDDEELEGWLE